MKLSGQATALCSIDPTLSRLITHHFPAAHSAGSFFPLSGQHTGKVVVGDNVLLARDQRADYPIPGVDRRREYAILRKLAGSGLGPQVFASDGAWLLLEWQPGDALEPQEFVDRLEPVAHLISALHRRPLSGYRLSVTRLLEQYWQLSRPDRRYCGWLRALRQLRARGEPAPLRLAPLHMDIHSGNVVKHQERLTLIDWEYASDGDVALELASVVAGNDLDAQQQARLVGCYATLQQIDPALLHQQMRRWQPWLRLLMASWYELRWQQTQQQNFYTLAGEAWQRVLSD